MIAKILTQSKTFSAIEYNEKKIEKNLGDFVEGYNFGYLDVLSKKTAKNYLRYFEQWSEKNKNIKNKQLHVSISCRGREYNKEELVMIGKKWLEEMGYTGLPTMIYFHRDTDNNHIHIITTRIGIDGKKINNNNERYRARDVINRIMNYDLGKNCRNDFLDALNYDFHGIKQFEMIMETKGYNISILNNQLQVAKEGKILLIKDIELINWIENRRKNYRNENKNLKRNKMIYSITKKYIEKNNLEDFVHIMRNKFKLSFLFFGKKDSYYGYAVVDHIDKRVIKGSDIFKLKNLLLENNREDRIKNIINNFFELDNNNTRNSLNKELKKWGCIIFENKIIEKSSKKVLLELNNEQLSIINYNFRLENVLQYNIKNSKEIRILSTLFSVNSEDIFINDSYQQGIDIDLEKKYYRNLLTKNEEGNIQQEILLEQGIFIVKDEENLFMIDNNRKRIYSFEELNIDLESQVDRKSSKDDSKEYSYNNLDNNIEDFIDIFFNNDINSGGADNSLKKKRRR